ncbi:Sua5/YciO/YrdC/YwlC family protein [Phytophthora nicotianae CJ01A1]|uniref:Threonylcarbamoyl-AMP synthase n=3 Tax=Phytophthora nicotianae TaxID=4792 RepID=W2HI45_PHYNI|nr:Sua5/YciO/YrdC/YwlC family protein [Phytophthora nicotianae]ETL47558.1 Sua5/YciO/YrdC/YwlC family protein [Phytophthora nicotianae]ETO83065.1 Sua5/YciO/YrdC/YwlC family protein [Phytophthora nicotianae P1976]ETP24133.1 Sua5/YciO/YrdC/YwlC family protein [Phytophthora nicotianae CJ01A1]
MARLLKPDAEGFAFAAQQLRLGQLVSFPTETVYGLGANALNPEAVLAIFEAKARPLTDPLIVHVPALEDAVKLVDMTPTGQQAFECLGKAFWPGPLTLIAKAVPELPLTLSANTGFVGLRCPKHPIAQALLKEAKVPVAAPSANRFGHVSPTTAKHVMDDLGACKNLSVIEATAEGCCEVGIESTVVKIVPEERKLIVFRRGGVSEQALEVVLKENVELLGGQYEVVTIQKEAKMQTKEAQQAPGQMITHYAPDVDTYLYQEDAVETMAASLKEDVSRWVVIDFHGKLVNLKDRVRGYLDLSPTGDVAEASQRIFDSLRWSENVQGVERVIITGVSLESHEQAAALYDRMYRAASGKQRALQL